MVNTCTVPLSCEPAANQFLFACRIPGKGRTTTNTEHPYPNIFLQNVNVLEVNQKAIQKIKHQDVRAKMSFCTFLSSLRADTSKFATLVSVISSAQI